MEYLEGRITCLQCRETFDTIEGNSSGFCSDDCSDAFADDEEFTELYWSAGDAAPVFP